ncbi:hypothetical protein V8B97DRAFT_2026170 [Scleroderma yunnanense]
MTYIRWSGMLLNVLKESVGYEIGKKTKECIVDPMPINNFLDTFLPISHFEHYSSTRDHFEPKISFAKTATITKELHLNQLSKLPPKTAMYEPFIKEMECFAPNLHFIDTHTQGDKKSGYKTLTSCKASPLETHIKFKQLGQPDPFMLCGPGIDQSKTSFISPASDHQDTLGQLMTYTACQLASQFRTHCFSIFILGHIAHIIQWDREGVIVTKLIKYIKDSSLIEFFSNLAQAQDRLCGINIQQTLDLPPETEMFKTWIEQFTVIFPQPYSPLSTPACHGTCTCHAYDLSSDHVVFFKDSWHINLANIIPEGKVYAKLNSKQVPYVLTCLTTYNVPCWPKQEPQTFKYSQYPWAYQAGLQIMPHIHHLIKGHILIVKSYTRMSALGISSSTMAGVI